MLILDGKRESLDQDYKVAGRKLKALVARRKRELASGREWLNQPFSVLADEYTADIEGRSRPPVSPCGTACSML